jgi:hypothetical protein
MYRIQTNTFSKVIDVNLYPLSFLILFVLEYRSSIICIARVFIATKARSCFILLNLTFLIYSKTSIFSVILLFFLLINYRLIKLL